MSSPVCSGQSAYPHTPRGVDTFCFLGPRLPAGRAFLRATTPLSTSSCSDTLCTCPEAGERTSICSVRSASRHDAEAGRFVLAQRTHVLEHIFRVRLATCNLRPNVHQCKRAVQACVQGVWGKGGGRGAYLASCTSCPGQRASLQRAPPAHAKRSPCS